MKDSNKFTSRAYSFCLIFVACMYLCNVAAIAAPLAGDERSQLNVENEWSTTQCFTDGSDPTGESPQIQSILQRLADENDGTTAIAVGQTEGGDIAQVNGDTQMPTRSTYKVYVAYAILKAIKDGKLTWANVSTDFNNMILNSDNAAATRLRLKSEVGGPSGITQLLQDKVGLSNKTIMGSGGTDNSNSKSTANDFVKFLRKLENRDLPGLDKTADSGLYEHLLSAMKSQTARTTGIKKGVGSGTEVADKPGWGPSPDAATNDIGIVYLPNKYAIAILTDYGNENWAYVAKIAKQVNEAMQAGGATTGASGTPTSLIGPPGTEPTPPEDPSGGAIKYKAAGNIPIGGKTVGASYYGGRWDSTANAFVADSADDAGNSASGPQKGHATIAELSLSPGSLDFNAMGGLPYGKRPDGSLKGTKLELTYKGKKIIAQKYDVGGGGGDVQGKQRAIDLWWETANLLKFDPGGTDLIKVRAVADNTPVTPVDGAATDASDDSSAAGGCACSESDAISSSIAAGTATTTMKDFITKYGQATFDVGKRYGIPYDAILAQVGQESGWGAHTPPDSNNLFGIKNYPGWEGETVSTGTQEDDGNGNLSSTTAAFIKFNSIEEGIEGYAQFIHRNPRYSKALKHPQNPVRYIQEIKNAGYATDTSYVTNVVGVLKTAQKYIKDNNLFPPSSEVVPDGAPPTAGGSTTSSSGCFGGGNGDAATTAVNYAWPTYMGAGWTAMKPTYKAAFEKARDEGKYVGGEILPGIDCGGFTTRAMQDSGADPNYGGGGYTVIQEQYMKDHPDMYQLLPSPSSGDLLPGDIAINDGHTYMFVGDQPNFETQIASASLDSRAPMAGKEAPADPDFRWYRLK